MKVLNRTTTAVVLLAAGVWVGCSTAPSSPSAKTESAKPAKLEGTATKEADLPTIALTDAADLGIRIEEANEVPGAAVRRFAGEVVVPSGNGLTVSSPLAGVVEAAPGGLPAVGAAVAKDQALFQVTSFVPILRDDARANGEAELAQARARLELARQRKALADKLRTGDGTLVQARARLDAARQRKTLADRMRTGDGALLEARARLDASRQRKAHADRMRTGDGALLEARTRLETARQRKARADKALADNVGTARAQEEAQQEVTAATRAVEAIEIQLTRNQEEADREVSVALSGVEASEIQLGRNQEEAQHEVNLAVSAVDAAEVQLGRNQEDAQLELTAATAAVQSLEDRLRQLQSGPPQVNNVVTVRAPHRGILRQVFAAPGQALAAGAPLFELVDLGTVWLRVPVYAGEAAQVAAQGPAQVQALGGTGQTWTVNPVRDAPPSSDAASSTVDFYYALPNADRRFRPGEKLSVLMPSTASRSWIAVPWSAVVFDTSGGTWVYESVGNNRYSRRRVDLDHTREGRAYLNSGVRAGAKIVAAGAAELWGFEFGTGK